MDISGKAVSIISRFPDFYNSDDQSNLFHEFIDIFGQILEQVETDLIRVLHSHYVDTADNLSFPGFDAKEKGDLDKIFALYLETFGGTSQLMQVNQQFQPADFKQISSLVHPLVGQTDDLAKYIWREIPDIQEILRRYDVSNSRFQPQDFIAPASLIVKLIAGKDALTLYLYLHPEFSQNTRQLLQNYDGSLPVPTAILKALAKEFNRIIKDRFLYKKFQERSTQIKLALAIQGLIDSRLAVEAIRSVLGQTLYRKLSLSAQKLLLLYTESSPSTEQLLTILAKELNPLLQNATVCQQLLTLVTEAWVKLALEIKRLINVSLVAEEANLLNSVRANLARTLRIQLSATAQNFLKAYDGSRPPNDQLRETLVTELNLLLQNAAVGQQVLTVASQGKQITIKPFNSQLTGNCLGLLLQETDTLTVVTEAEQTLLKLASPQPTGTFLELLLQATHKQLGNLLAGFSLGDRCLLPEPILSDDAKQLIDQSPTGDDLERLNRMLLEAIYPQEIRASSPPPKADVQKALAKAFNDNILTDATFYQQNAANFSQRILTPETLKLIAQQPTGEELKRLNRLLLEAAYSSEIEKSYVPYRERLKRLINVLKNGASTKEGIVDIVAANLGIGTDNPDAVKPWEQFLFDLPLECMNALKSSIQASPELRQIFRDRGTMLSFNTTVFMEESDRHWLVTDTNSTQVYVVRKQENQLSVHRQLIRVVEFSPESQTQPYKIHPRPRPLPADGQTLTLPIEFVVNNPNPVPTTPTIEIQIGDARTNREQKLVKLNNLRLVNRTTGQFVQYDGLLDPNNFDLLLWLPDGTVLVNGISKGNAGTIPSLPCGESHWYVEASIGTPKAVLDQTLFDLSRFDKELAQPLQPNQAQSYALNVGFTFYKLTPGSLDVKIPWDISGYTDKFDETHDHPRHQIKSLIDKVKAAGVNSVISYEKQFEEHQDLRDALLKLEGRLSKSEIQEIEEFNFDIGSQQAPYPGGITHEMKESFATSAVFDYTRFDSLNTLA